MRAGVFTQLYGIEMLIAQLIGLAIIDRVDRRRLTPAHPAVRRGRAQRARLVLGHGQRRQVDDPVDHRHLIAFMPSPPAASRSWAG
jgi:hypothetical protein